MFTLHIDINSNVCFTMFTEQKCFEIEKELVVSNAKLQTECKSSTELRQQLSDLGE